MRDYFVLDDDGETPVPVPDVTTDPDGFSAAMHNSRKRYDWVVAKTTVGEYEVSTVFLFSNHGIPELDGPIPILWESLVFGDGPWANYMQRYRFRREAKRGHAEIVQRIRDSEATDARIRELRREADRLRDEMLGYSEQEAMMPDTDTRDHREAIRRALEHERRHGGSLALDLIEQHADALAAERDALRAYVLWLEGFYTSDHASTTESDDALRSRIRHEYGVSGLLRDA